MDVTKDIYDLLKSKGKRVTKQKQTLLSILFANMDRMLSVNEISRLIPDEENMDNATIYRNINSLTGLGILENIVDEKGIARYVIDAVGEHHHHMICISCGKIFPIPCKDIYWAQYAKENNFQETYHKLEVYGKCEKCNKL